MRRIFQITILTSLGNLFYKSLVLMYLWNWYITLIFEKREINYLLAFGICLIADILRSGDVNFYKSTEKDEMVVHVKASFWWLTFVDTSLIFLLGFLGHLLYNHV